MLCIDLVGKIVTWIITVLAQLKDRVGQVLGQLTSRLQIAAQLRCIVALIDNKFLRSNKYGTTHA